MLATSCGIVKSIVSNWQRSMPRVGHPNRLDHDATAVDQAGPSDHVLPPCCAGVDQIVFGLLWKIPKSEIVLKRST